MNNRIVKINDYMSYLPATEDPLSADVGIVYTKAGTFFFLMRDPVRKLLI